ncbi:MAG: hypothetical protein RIB58_14260 [Phycisphaerales bacterium]|jgi:hypothetical protein
MTEGDTQTAQASPPNQAGTGDGAGDLHDVCISFGLDEALRRLGQAARRGKLPEFHPGGPDGALFRAGALGHPFDRDLLAWSEPRDGGLRLRFGLRWRRKAPIIYLAAMIVTVEPGRYFLELMIPGSWGWGSIMWWYYPLTIIPIPLAWRHFMRQARNSTLESAKESHSAIVSILNAEPAEDANVR